MGKKQWVVSAQKIIRFWIFQIVLAFALVAGISCLAISSPEGIVWLIPLAVLLGLGSTIFYAFRIADFFRAVNSLNSGGGNSSNDFKSMKISLLLDVLFCFIFPFLTIFTKIFFWVMYRSRRH